MKVALIGICRYANEYVEEWINHYLSIGIDHIYLCDNNDVNDDSLEHLLFNKFKNVSLINLRSDPHPSFIELQDKAYTTLYQLYLKCKLFYKKTIIILNKKYIHKTP